MTFIQSGLLVSILALSACASNVPQIIKTPPSNNPDLQQVVAQPKKHLTQKVRWGGAILNTENRVNSTRLTILAMPLHSDGEPNSNGAGLGRFVADFKDFLEPSIYANSRLITLVGEIQAVETLKVGEYPYPHPVVQANAHYLWPLAKPSANHDWPPFWYEPWYYPYPYYRPYRPVRP